MCNANHLTFSSLCNSMPKRLCTSDVVGADVPLHQPTIQDAGLFVINATQMVESMTLAMANQTSFPAHGHVLYLM